MSRRRITRTLGAAAGGLLGFAFLPAAAALADDYVVTPDTSSTETVTGIYGYGFDGLGTAPPALAGTVQGDQPFDYSDVTTGETGTFSGYEDTSTDTLGESNVGVYVASDTSGADAPPVGSVFDTYTFGDGLYENIYSAIPSAGGDQISDILVTPGGDYTIPVTFDAAAATAVDAGGVPIGNGDDIVPVADSQLIVSLSGIPPLDESLQGNQIFNVSSGGGSFESHEAITQDIIGFHTEAVLVSQDDSGTVGTAAGDTPAVGSIFNTISLGGVENVYSDLVSSSGANVITDTVETSSGDFTIPVTFDAAEVESLSNGTDVDVPDSYQIDPSSDFDFTGEDDGINGLPPINVGVQGTQDFGFTDGGQSGSFTADVTNTLDALDNSTETILVTSSSNADALPVGSVFETVTWGDTGFGNIYSDIASTAAGGDIISDTLVTPFGDFTVPMSFDGAAGLAGDLFGI
jgi:hypothetical protein